MPTLQSKLEAEIAALSADERAAVEAVGADVATLPSELRAKLATIASHLSDDERAEFRASLDPADVEGHMINSDRGHITLQGHESDGTGGGGRLPGLLWKYTPGLGNGLEPGWKAIDSFF